MISTPYIPDYSRSFRGVSNYSLTLFNLNSKVNLINIIYISYLYLILFINNLITLKLL